jgi:thiamine-phosphate pyrophosphorylase
MRIMDANLNRASEGLRFMEDVARFLLNDAALSEQLKTARHGLAREARALGVQLLSQRDSEGDVGAELSGEAEQDLGGLVSANAKRAEESLRVMAELAKLPELRPKLNTGVFEELRFSLYTLERSLVSGVLRRHNTKRLSGLYVILDRQALAGRDMVPVARQVVEGGARVVQLRDKQSSRSEMLAKAQAVKALCDQSNVLFIVNDYVDLALAADADGVHAGQKDLPLPAIRRLMPIDKIVGCSVNTVAEAVKARDEGADYIAVGAMFPTRTKETAVVVGVERLKQVREAVSTPLVAIGGIDEDNIGQVLAAGADSAAVVSAALGTKDVRGAVRRLVERVDSLRGSAS